MLRRRRAAPQRDRKPGGRGLPPDMDTVVLALSDVMFSLRFFRSPLPLLPRRLQPTGTRIRGASIIPSRVNAISNWPSQGDER